MPAQSVFARIVQQRIPRRFWNKSIDCVESSVSCCALGALALAFSRPSPKAKRAGDRPSPPFTRETMLGSHYRVVVSLLTCVAAVLGSRAALAQSLPMIQPFGRGFDAEVFLQEGQALEIDVEQLRAIREAGEVIIPAFPLTKDFAVDLRVQRIEPLQSGARGVRRQVRARAPDRAGRGALPRRFSHRRTRLQRLHRRNRSGRLRMGGAR